VGYFEFADTGGQSRDVASSGYAGVTDRLWDVSDLVTLWEQYERRAERAA